MHLVRGVFSSIMLATIVSKFWNPIAFADAVTTNDKPSLASNPIVVVALVIGGLVGIMLSIFALRALWRAKQYETE